MASTIPFPSFASLLLFFCLSPLSSVWAIESLDIPSSVTPKAAAIQYWNLKVGSNKLLPPAFLSKLSTQSAVELLITDADNMKSFYVDRELENHPEASEKIHRSPFFGSDVREKILTFPAYGSDARDEKLAYKNHAENDAHIRMVEATDASGISFRENSLRKGNTMPFVDFRGLLPHQHFVPRSIASTTPFTSADAVKKMFHISPADGMASKAVDHTVEHCNMHATNPAGEIKKCITSAEDMIDFVIKGLGSVDIEARSTESNNGCGDDVLIGDVKLVSGDGSATCHQTEFPYLVYFCHIVPKTKVYEVEILDAKSKEKINQGTVMCHMDTSMWSPTHEAFKALNSEPGKIEVCHFNTPWDMVWTSAGAASFMT